MILTTNINISDTNLTAKIAPKNQSFPKTVTGPSGNESPNKAVYLLTEYDYKNNGVTIPSPTPQQLVEFDTDKDHMEWAFWINGGLMDNTDEYVIISNRSLQPETDTDITLTTDGQVLKDNLSSNGYLEATVETIIDNGDKLNKLTIKFSKWLDAKTVHVEPFRKTPDHDEVKSHVQTTALKAPAEIINAYWINQQQQFISSSGFATNISLVVISLGLIGESIVLSMHDDDAGEDNVDDDIMWNNNGTYENSRNLNITARTTIMSFQVESISSPAFSSANEPLTEGDALETYLKITDALLDPNNADDRFAPLLLVSQAQVTRIFFSEKIDNVFGSGETYYAKIDTVYPGMMAYLVAECHNLNGQSAQFSVMSQDSVLVPTGTKLPLIEDGIEKTDFTAVVINDFAAVQVIFQEIGSTTYDSWLASLMPENGNLEESILQVSAIVNSINYDSSETFKIVVPITRFEIYPNHKVYKYLIESAVAGSYTYFQADGTGHSLGVVKFKNIKNTYDQRYGSKYNPSVINLVDLRNMDNFIDDGTGEFFRYLNGSLDVEIYFNTSRYFMNEDTLACLIGAVFNNNLKTLTFNGFSLSDGAPGPSKSHKNGYNGDFRYLREDMTGGLLYLNLDEKNVASDIEGWQGMDEDLQQGFIDDLYGFGWKSFRSQKYGLNKLEKLSRTTPDDKGGHYDHLHAQGFNHDSILIK